MVKTTTSHAATGQLTIVLPATVQLTTVHPAMEQRTFKNVNNCLNTNIYCYLETSGGQSSNPHLNIVHFFNARVN